VRLEVHAEVVCLHILVHVAPRVDSSQSLQMTGQARTAT
jgi:hypothetical protein